MGRNLKTKWTEREREAARIKEKGEMKGIMSVERKNTNTKIQNTSQ